MKFKCPPSLTKCCFLLAVLFLSVNSDAQRGYQIKVDPVNKSRRVVQLDAATKRANEVLSLRNVLDADVEKRKPIEFKPFEMRHPKTGKALNPEGTLTITMADGSKKTTSVKKFFEDLNNLEKALNQKGRSLRMANAFAGLRPVFNASVYKKIMNAPAGFNTQKFELNNKPAQNKYTKSFSINTPLFFKPGFNVGSNLKLVDWQPKLYIADRFENEGTTEFPAEWVAASSADKGRNKFPLLIQVPKGFESLVTKVMWQVSDKPFDGTLKDISPASVKKSGIVYPTNWYYPRGVDILPNTKNYKYTTLYVDLEQIEKEPVGQIKQYYVRLIIFNKSDEVLKFTNEVGASYGSVDIPIKFALPEYHSVPEFNYSYPEGNSMPFGLFVRGEGFRSVKATEYLDKDFTILGIKGYKVSASAALGVKYFNFLSLVNDAEPANKEFEIIKARFTAIAGKGTSPSYGNETPGVSLNISALNGAINTPVTLTETLPGVSAISLNYTVKQSLDMELVNVRFFIGPVPIKVSAGITGEAGLEMSGAADLDKKEISGTIRPYLSSAFNASGGVDAVIAYATLNAEVNPLLSIDMPMSFNSTAEKPITFRNSISGLSGRVFLKAGFYYPCPSLEKIVGFLTGDEDLPLCECNWEYNIFDFNGFSIEFNY